MLHTPHFLAGVAIAAQVPEVLPASLAAITLHFVMDAVPHSDYIGETPKLNRPNIAMVLVDVAIALAIFFTIVAPEYRLYAFIIGVLSVLPDFIMLPGYFWPKWWELPGIKQLHHWHSIVIQYNRELPIPKRSWRYWFWGLLPQVILVAILIYIIVYR